MVDCRFKKKKRVIDDELVKSHIPYVVHASTKPVLSEPSTLRPFDRLTAQGESREARDNLLIFRSAELAEA